MRFEGTLPSFGLKTVPYLGHMLPSSGLLPPSLDGISGGLGLQRWKSDTRRVPEQRSANVAERFGQRE